MKYKRARPNSAGLSSIPDLYFPQRRCYLSCVCTRSINVPIFSGISVECNERRSIDAPNKSGRLIAPACGVWTKNGKRHLQIFVSRQPRDMKFDKDWRNRWQKCQEERECTDRTVSSFRPGSRTAGSSWSAINNHRTAN